MVEPIRIRLAGENDAAGCLEIYRPIVVETVVSFEAEVPTSAEMARRIRDVGRSYPWLIAQRDGATAGYAYGCRHRERAAYRWSAEVSVYVAEAHRRHGVARALYARLLEGLTVQGYANAFAGIALPNDASVAFHRSMEFEPVGVYHRIGYKMGRWIDVGWWERRLRDESSPAEPRPTQYLVDTHGWE